MRFLLHPQRVMAATRGSPQQQVASTKLLAAATAWGQQCSPTCGCVVRFEAHDNHELQYTAKQLVLLRSGQPVYTRKGRPMLQACTCNRVHHLCGALVERYRGNPHWRRVAATELEFAHVRSAPAFGAAVLHSQGFHVAKSSATSTTTRCFDVVEEAWTALVKGYLPPPRRRLQHSNIASSFGFDDEPEPQPQPALSWRTTFWSDNDDDSSDESSVTTAPSLSTLSLFDWNQQQQAEEEERLQQQRRQQEAARKPPPSDWQSYVDQLYFQQAGEEEYQASWA